MTKIRVVIDLEYDLEDITLDDLLDTNQTSLDTLEDLVYDDLTDLMRGDRLSSWAEITEANYQGE